MCLNVEKRLSGIDTIIRKCYKEMVKYRVTDTWLTPYRYVRINNDGILCCEDSVLRHTSITKNFIHAWQEGHQKPRNTKYDKLFHAYAINVKALGHSSDLACKLLYIPELDTINNAGYLRTELDKVIKNPNWQDIHRLFPNYLRSFPLIEKIDWDKIFREMGVNSTQCVEARCDSDAILARIPRSQTAVSYLNRLSYKNFMDKFKRAYNAKRNKALHSHKI